MACDWACYYQYGPPQSLVSSQEYCPCEESSESVPQTLGPETIEDGRSWHKVTASQGYDVSVQLAAASKLFSACIVQTSDARAMIGSGVFARRLVATGPVPP